MDYDVWSKFESQVHCGTTRHMINSLHCRCFSGLLLWWYRGDIIYPVKNYSFLASVIKHFQKRYQTFIEKHPLIHVFCLEGKGFPTVSYSQSCNKINLSSRISKFQPCCWGRNETWTNDGLDSHFDHLEAGFRWSRLWGYLSHVPFIIPTEANSHLVLLLHYLVDDPHCPHCTLSVWVHLRCNRCLCQGRPRIGYTPGQPCYRSVIFKEMLAKALQDSLGHRFW